MDSFVAALGTPTGDGEASAVRKHKTAVMADGGFNHQPFGRPKTPVDMFHMGDDLFFGYPDGLGQIPDGHGVFLKLGHDEFSQRHFSSPRKGLGLLVPFQRTFAKYNVFPRSTRTLEVRRK